MSIHLQNPDSYSLPLIMKTADCRKESAEDAQKCGNDLRTYVDRRRRYFFTVVSAFNCSIRMMMLFMILFGR